VNLSVRPDRDRQKGDACDQAKPSEAELSASEHVDEPCRLRIRRPPAEQGQYPDPHPLLDVERAVDEPESAIIVLHAGIIPCPMMSLPMESDIGCPRIPDLFGNQAPGTWRQYGRSSQKIGWRSA
jgi:hypothetical protein